MPGPVSSILDRLGSRPAWVTAVDLILVYYLIYRALLTIRGTRAAQMVVGIVLVGAGFYAARRLELTAVSWLLDAVINYKTQPLAETLKAAMPKGIDVYFENVGGAVQAAVVVQPVCEPATTTGPVAPAPAPRPIAAAQPYPISTARKIITIIPIKQKLPSAYAIVRHGCSACKYTNACTTRAAVKPMKQIWAPSTGAPAST